MSVSDARFVADQDLMNAELQRRCLEPRLLNLIVGLIMTSAIAAFLWSHASHRGLVIWVSLVTVTLALPALLQWVQPNFKTFYWSIIVAEILSGIGWGSGALIAMPDTAVTQSILLMLFIGVLMSGGTNMAHFLGVFASFNGPLAITVAIGFLRTGMWPAGPFLTIWIAGLAYVTASAFDAQKTQHELVRGNLELAAANRQLDVQSRTDKLTGLANRLDFTEQLEAQIAACGQRLSIGNNPDADTEPRSGPTATSPNRPVTLGYLDIDRFKQINDEFGHHAGDELLRQSAERLLAAATESELVARLGGDELTVLSSVDAHSLGVRVLGCFDQPFMIDGRTLPVNVSVGVASSNGDVSGEQLMRNADAALYASKGAGGGQHRVFGTALKLQHEERATRETELHAALLAGEIVPWLQPILDLATGEIVAAEALARWTHDGGVRSAASFIDMIRQIGMMAEFTEQLVAAIVDFRRSVHESGARQIPISINVPCSHLQQLVGIEDLGPLVIEVTEETAIDEIGETRAVLQELRSAGHQIWLDDFGTGFSSMAVAAQLPIDGLKIDPEFVANMLASASVRGVVAAMVELGAQLDVDVVAEGVEDMAQARLLRDTGIRLAQGHLWSPAVPFAEFAAWLKGDVRFPVRPDHERTAAD